MNGSKQLKQLAMLQNLSEQRQRREVARVERACASSARRYNDAAQSLDAAEANLHGKLSGRSFCPDRMLLAGQAVTVAAERQATASSELTAATKATRAARREWETAVYRSGHLQESHREQLKQEARKSDDRRDLDQISRMLLKREGIQR